MKKATRAEGRPTGGGRVARPSGGGAPAANPEDMPAFELPSSSVLEKAASEKRPLVIYFADEKDDGAALADPDIKFLSSSAALFVKIPNNPDREESPWASESIVPASKLLSENPSRDYDIKVGVATVLVADWHGNEFYRFTSIPSATELRSSVNKVADKMETANRKLQKNYDAAKTAWGAKDRATALKSIIKNFKEDMVGLAAQEETIRLYHEIMDAARADITAMGEKGDKAGLEKAVKELKGTDVAKEASEALAKLK